MNLSSRMSVAVVSLSFALLTGCYVSSHGHGKNDNVDIGTPFGSMQVKTNENVNPATIGITQYPGSTPVTNDHDSDSADVNMSFGNFHLGVKAASFQSSDGEDKIVAFYRKDLKRYGDVLECRGTHAVGKPDRTSQGLTCEENKGSSHGNVELGTGLELRTGSPQRQHIVALEEKNGGTKIGLVALELPSQIHSHGDSEVD